MCYCDPSSAPTENSHVWTNTSEDIENMMNVRGSDRNFRNSERYSNCMSGITLLHSFYNDPVSIAVNILSNQIRIYPAFYRAISKIDAAYIMQFSITFMLPDLLRDVIEYSDWTEYGGSESFLETEGWSYYGRHQMSFDTKRLSRDSFVPSTVEEYFMCRNMDPYTPVQILRILFCGMSRRGIYPFGIINLPVFISLLELKKKSFDDNSTNEKAQKRFRDMFIRRLERFQKHIRIVLENKRPDGTSGDLSADVVEGYSLLYRWFTCFATRL